jgi:hypothetical protein
MEQEVMAIYDPIADTLLEVEQPKKYVTSWAIRVEWDNGETEDILDIPDDVAMTVDGWLTEVEEQQFEFNGEGI